jgi:NAD(P)-dependent dehydrogenase (short-subunit alcohol dehydrogenase family)
MSGARIVFDGEVAVVTGAGRGIGREHALELARRGARVVVNDISPEHADEVVVAIGAAGGEAVACYASAASRDGAQALIAETISAFGAIHAVINNAGIMRNGYIEDLDAAGVDAVIDVNLRGVYFICQAAWPHLRGQGYGRIVLTSSAGGLYAMQGESNYAAAKGGVYGLGKALASEGLDHGIKVNTLLPMAQTTMSAGDPVPGYQERYPAWAGEVLRPRRLTGAVSPLAALLASRACPGTGEAFAAGFGRYARVFVGETRGWRVEDPSEATAEAILDNWDVVQDPEGFGVPADIYEDVVFIANSLGFREP